MADPPLEVPLVDLQAQRRRLGASIDRALARVLDHGRFILGPEVARLEHELAGRCGVAHAVACSSGTDALLLALLTHDVGPGDAVLVPAFTFAATAEVVVRCGATPVLVDVRADTFTIDPESAAAAQVWASDSGLRPVGIIPVDLFGHPADYEAVGKTAAEGGLWVVADAAQSLGGSLQGRPVGALAGVTATSFFPAKPLGCYGDGGALFTDSAELAERLCSLRVHGQGQGGRDKDDVVRVGINGRLDTLQAAILLAKLEVFDEERARRQEIARRYAQGLADVVTVPTVVPGATSAWACYTIRSPQRDQVRRHLRQAGIASAIYYPRPLHRQTAFGTFPAAPRGLPVAGRLAGEVLSLPMHPYLDRDTQDRVIEEVRSAVRSGA